MKLYIPQITIYEYVLNRHKILYLLCFQGAYWYRLNISIKALLIKTLENKIQGLFKCVRKKKRHSVHHLPFLFIFKHKSSKQ